MSNGQSTLKNLYSRSFPGQNLLEVSIVEDTDPNLPFYKSKVFGFITVTPGGKTNEGNRTFNREGKITMKVELEKLLGLSNSITMYCHGADQIAKFAIFSDSSKSTHGHGNFKICSASVFMKDNPQQGGQEKNISIGIKQGQSNPIGVYFVPSEALAVAHILKFMAEKGFEKDYKLRANQTPGNINPGQSYNAQAGYSQAAPTANGNPNPNPNTAPDISNNFSNTMNQQGGGGGPTDNPPPFVTGGSPFPGAGS